MNIKQGDTVQFANGDCHSYEVAEVVNSMVWIKTGEFLLPVHRKKLRKVLV